jgi:hypothetical protein
MEVLTGEAVGGVRRCEPLTFTIYLGPVTGLSDTPPEAAALIARQLTEAPSAGSGSLLRTYVYVPLARDVITATPVAHQARRWTWRR